MSWLSSLFGSKNLSSNQEPTSFTIRQGKSIPIDDAFRAWTSGNLEDMLKAVNTQNNPIDRHFLLQSIVTESYKLRKEEKYRKFALNLQKNISKNFLHLLQLSKRTWVAYSHVLPLSNILQQYSQKTGNLKKQLMCVEKRFLLD
jgi:hypothetical protein